MSWRVATVAPVFKIKGSVADPSFYHPVSVMPTLALLLVPKCIILLHLLSPKISMGL